MERLSSRPGRGMARAPQMNVEAAVGDGIGEVAQTPRQEHRQAEGPGHDAEEQRQILQAPAAQAGEIREIDDPEQGQDQVIGEHHRRRCRGDDRARQAAREIDPQQGRDISEVIPEDGGARS